jgi:hypothetical protein
VETDTLKLKVGTGTAVWNSLSYIPGAADEYHEYANLAAFPGTGVADRIYEAQDTGKLYHWNGSAYVQIADKAAVGLALVDNTSDATKNSAAVALTNKNLTSGTNTFPTFNQNTTGSAATLTTPRNINGVPFDGSADISTSTPTAVKTAAYTAAVSDLIPADATSAAFTVTLPSAPADKSRVVVKKIDATTNIVTIAAAGSDVFNLTAGATALTLLLQYQAVVLQYKASGGIWYVVSTDVPLGGLDTRYLGPLATGTADTATIQALIDAANTAGGGTILLRSGQTYVTTGLVMKSNVILDLNGSTIKLANSTSASVIATLNYATLIGGDTTGGATNFVIRNGTLDGNKTNQAGTASTFAPVLGIYGYYYTLENLTICNGYGTGLDTQWSTNSAFINPHGFMSFIHHLIIQNCAYHGLNFRGPHDSFISDILVEKCSESSAAVPFWFPDASGRANGTNVETVHVYGGGGYNHGVVLYTAGIQARDIISEGGQVGQFLIQAGQIQLLDFHAYTGGIQTAAAVGVLMGDSSHTGVNGCIIRGRVENCGGGAIDCTYMGWNNDVDIQHFYISSTTPSVTNLGIVGTLPPRNNFRLHTTDSGTGSGNTFYPTSGTLTHAVGPHRFYKANPSDTRNLLELRDEAGSTITVFDYRGRRRVNTSLVPTIAAGAGAGTSPTVTISGDDTAGTITITVGTSPAAGILATVTFSGVFGNNPHVILTPGDATSAVKQLYATRSTSAFSVRCVGTPTAADAYIIYYQVVGA